MNNLIIVILATGAYLISALLLTLNALREKNHRSPLYLAWFAVALHCYILSQPYLQTLFFNFSFFNIASLISGLVSLLLLIAAINKPVEKLGIALFPITALMLGLNHLLPHTVQQLQTYTAPMHLHILSSIIAFSLLNIAALQAILLALHERQLRNHPPKRFILR
ncbi:MAG: phosphohydrolase, partial [Methylococcales bacterium]